MRLNTEGLSAATVAGTIGGIAAIAAGIASCFLGPIPLYQVPKLGISRSNKNVKFRATGPVFLAYQAGEYEGVAADITCELTGPLKWAWLMALKNLFVYSRTRDKTDYYTKNETTGQVAGLSKFQPLSGVLSGSTVRIPYANIFFNPLNWQQVNFSTSDMSTLESGGTTTIGKNTYFTKNTIYHKTFPFISKAEVIIQAYIDTFVIQWEAMTSDKIVVDLLIREFREESDWQEILLKREGRGGARANIINNYQLWLFLNGLMAGSSTAVEVGRAALMRRINIADIIAEDVLGAYGRMWSSEPLNTDIINDLEPRILIYDPDDPDESDPVDVNDWYYFNLNSMELPLDVSISTQVFGGEQTYHLLFYLVDDAPMTQLGFYEREQYVMCIVKDDNENITDRFRITDGIVYKIGDGHINICFDEILLHYNPEFYTKLGHVITGRWFYV